MDRIFDTVIAIRTATTSLDPASGASRHVAIVVRTRTANASVQLLEITGFPGLAEPGREGTIQAKEHE
jgi:hypothetical protein